MRLFSSRSLSPILFALTLLWGLSHEQHAMAFSIDQFDDDSALGWSAEVAATTDSDGDGACDDCEGDGDKDNDGIPDSEDYDPTGYFYDISNGRIIPGGSVSVSGANLGECINNLVDNGSDGSYQFIGLTIGTCVITVTPPPGYQLASMLCADGVEPFDVPTGPAPVTLGNSEVGSTGFLSSAACTPYYFRLRYDSLADADVFENNFPLIAVGASAAPAASTYTLGAMIALLLALGIWRVALPQRQH